MWQADQPPGHSEADPSCARRRVARASLPLPGEAARTRHVPGKRSEGAREERKPARARAGAGRAREPPVVPDCAGEEKEGERKTDFSETLSAAGRLAGCQLEDARRGEREKGLVDAGGM